MNQCAKQKFTQLSQGNTLSVQQNSIRKMKIPTPNLCHNSQTILPAGIFLYPVRFTASTHLCGSITGQWQNLTALKTKSPWHFNTSLPTGKIKLHLLHLFQMFRTNSMPHSIQKSHCPRAIYWILNLPIHLTVIFKLDFGNSVGQPFHSHPPNKLLFSNIPVNEKTTYTCKLLLMDYVLRWT